MTKIMFKLKDDTPAGEIGASLKEICSLSELFNVRAVLPEVKDKGLRNLYSAEVAKGASTEKVLKKVKKAPYVETAYVPPVRRAM